jgi:tetratricopeptide (TPR) repeat protein
MQAIVKILPKQPLFRDNLAIYANYAGQFPLAEEEAKKVGESDEYAMLALAFAQTGQGRWSDASESYRKLSILKQGASPAASGLGDLAAVQGRFLDAVRLLRRGADDDLKAKNDDAAAAKLAAAAFAELSQGRFRNAIATAEEALRHSTAVKIRFLAARTFVEAGDAGKARPHVESLSKELYAEPRAYAKLVEGTAALKKGDARQAMDLMREANALFDTWIGQFDLGRASLAAGAYSQADSAFDVCLNARRGEAISLFVDEEPTYAYLPQVYYYQGRSRQGLKSAGFADSYRAYLALRGKSTEDPLVP